MYEWLKQIQLMIDEIDKSIIKHSDETLTLSSLSLKPGYSVFHTTRKFKEISGMTLRDYLRNRKLAFALKEVRDSKRSILDIALDSGFTSHEAFSRAFKKAFSISPKAYRKEPKPVILRTKINVFDRYFLGIGDIGMIKSANDVKIYFVTIPAHKFLHIRNFESNGYWDFWQKQSLIEGEDCDTICGLLDSIKGKLDDYGSTEIDSGSGQIMGYISDERGRLCDWGYPRIECYGVRLPWDYKGEIPPKMTLIDIPEADYVVFEHGPFDYNTECRLVEESVEKAMSSFNFEENGCVLDTTPGRITYYYHDPSRYFKYVRPVKKINLK